MVDILFGTRLCTQCTLQCTVHSVHSVPGVQAAGKGVLLLLLKLAHPPVDLGQQLPLEGLDAVVFLADLAQVLLQPSHNRNHLEEQLLQNKLMISPLQCSEFSP